VSGQAWFRKHVLFNIVDSFILLNDENISAISKKGGEVSANQKHIFQVGSFQVFIPLWDCCNTSHTNHSTLHSLTYSLCTVSLNIHHTEKHFKYLLKL